MIRKFALACLALSLLLAPASLADDEKPTIALLRFGPHLSYYLIDQGLLGGMRTAGLISEEEHAVLNTGAELQGERVNIARYDANYDFANTTFIVEQAIDAGADVLITYSTPVTQAASHVTSDMDEPPVVLFTAVFNPIVAGIARSKCVKPDHISGVEMATPYEDIVPLLLEQDPDIKVIGTLYSTAEASGLEGARRIAEVAETLGLEVEEAAVSDMSSLALAAEGLVESGVEALIIPADMTTVSALPIITQVAIENQLPVFHSYGFAHGDGATVAAGTTLPTTQGRLIAAMVDGHLAGSLDIASTGFATISEMNVSLNLDSARSQGVDIADSLLDKAVIIIEDGVQLNRVMIKIYTELGLDEETIDLIMKASDRMVGADADKVQMPPHVQEIVANVMRAAPRIEDAGAMLASLHCTPEMIAQQQAELDAANQ